jgi:hypothetical protein
MTAKRQRRPLNPPPYQPVAEVTVKTPHLVEIHGMLINPDTLHQLRAAGGTHQLIRGLINKGEPIVRARITARRTAQKPAPFRTNLVRHWSTSKRQC